MRYMFINFLRGIFHKYKDPSIFLVKHFPSAVLNLNIYLIVNSTPNTFFNTIWYMYVHHL